MIAVGAAAPRVRCLALLLPVLLLSLLVGCGGPVAASPSVAPAGQSSKVSGRAPSAAPKAVPSAVPEARQGRPARSSRVRFMPQSVILPGGARAEVQPAQTVDGELEVPEHVKHVGWWDGSSFAGDPFGTTVIAGHVDSATEGLGFFARLRRVTVGEKVSLTGDGHKATYRVISVQLVAKRALSSDSKAFDQTGDHRLVLITCGGSYDRSRGGYDSNLVVTAVPVGLAR
ncbi:MAG: class F sortase [Propionibacteriaceae bacterium]